jgi:phosphomevalonate kinase
MIEVKAPGKLFIAGEYAVIETGNPAILVAIDQYLTIQMIECQDKGCFVTTYPESISVDWTRKQNRIILENEGPFKHLIAALQVMEQIAVEEDKDLRYYRITIESDLAKDHRKYGLGSSSALLVATIKALSLFYKLNLNHLELFKAAALAQLQLNPLSSCGDIAASSFGGWIAYHKFDADWVLHQLKKQDTIKSLIIKDWPYLKIETLTPPSELKLLIGWTGSPASTSHYVKEVYEKRLDHPTEYNQFLKASKECVLEMIQAVKDSDIPLIQAGIRRNRQLLQVMSTTLGVKLETEQLRKLCELAESCGFAAKPSGAGGGDCGIAMGKYNSCHEQLLALWNKYHIQLLSIKVDE